MMSMSTTGRKRSAGASAFTLLEAMLGVAVISIAFLALYAGMTTGFGAIQLARENIGASQTLTEKFETLRLYSWDQINSNNFIPASFVVPMDATRTNSNFNYTGTVSIVAAPISEAYSNDLKKVTITLTWMSGSRLATRSVQGFVSRYGLQNYVY
jgi:type II secretory pathway pseudopilin PulG